MNDLYGDAMRQNRVLNKSDNSLHGYFLEVDLDYPEYLYDSHKIIH